MSNTVVLPRRTRKTASTRSPSNRPGWPIDPAPAAEAPASPPVPEAKVAAVTPAPTEAPVVVVAAANAVAGSSPSPQEAAVELRTTQGFQFQPAPRWHNGKLSTGVDRLDDLLGGGYSAGCATLLFGPPFCGKQQLQQQAIIRSARDGTPVTVLLHTIGAEAMSARLRAHDPTFAAAEESGLVRYIDVHSKALGEPTGFRHARYVEDPQDLSSILKALESPARSDGTGVRGPGLLAIESASTLLIDLGPAKAFTFLRTILGRTLTQGGVGLVCLEGGMHPESEVQMAKHLCAGMIEMRKKGEAHCLHVEGLETTYARPGWIEYEFTARTFRVTGSFASRTIR